MSSAYIDQVEQNINNLLANKKFKEAYDLANELVDKFSHDGKTFKIKKQVEEAVRNENERIVKNGIKEIKEMWKNKEYTEIIKKLKNLITISPENSKLQRLEQKAQLEYRDEIQRLQIEFKKNQNIKFYKLLEENEEKLIEELFRLEKNNQGNKETLEITKFFRDKLIDKKIKENKKLLESEKFEDINNFLGQLKRIEKNNEKVSKLEKKINIKTYGSQKEESKEHTYRSVEQIIVLMKLKKYDKVIQGAEELIKSNKENKEIEKILKKAKKKFFNETKNLTIDSIKNHMQELREEYKKNKDSFIKI
jgi:hypothetical protein